MIRTLALAALLAPAVAGAQSFDELMAKGRAQMDSGKSDDAVKIFEKAVKANEQSSVAHFMLARALGNVAEKASILRQPFLAKRVKSEFEKTVALDPTSWEGHEGLLQFYLRAPGVMGGSINKARDEAATIAKINPYRGYFAENNLANNEKDLARVEKNWRALYAAYPDSTQALANLASFLSNNNRAEEALPITEKFLSGHPENVLAKWWFARTTAVTGRQMDRGEQIMRQLLTIPVGQSPRVGYDALHYRLGDIYAKRGDKTKAKAEYEEALKINPKLEQAKKALEALK